MDQVPYSLDITPPLIISPPYYLHEFAAEVYLSPIYASPWPHGRTLRLGQMRGRLELIIRPYMEYNYLLASNTMTK